MLSIIGLREKNMKDIYDLSPLDKKKRINSRSKGSGFERQVAKILNETFDTKEFSRTPGSGAYATTHSLPKHLKIYGDLITPEKFRYCIEYKKGYNKLSIISLYDYSSDFWKFYEQCEKDSKKAEKEPLLIFKQDRKPALAMTTANNFSHTLKSIQLDREKDGYITKHKIYLLEDILEDMRSCWFS